MRAKPTFKISLAACSLALSGSAHSLGLGKLTVLSSLGQPLSAQIELSSWTREELESVTAKVADPAVYRDNNLTYQGALARARIAIDQGTEGKMVLTVTTPVAVNEPFMDLIVDLNWASGRVLRTYTFLLDPQGVQAGPADSGTRRAPLPPVASAPAPAPAPAPAATEPRQPAPIAEPRTAPRVAPPPPPPEPRAASQPTEARVAGGAGASYTVRRGDTLSKIAAQVKPDSATLDQMLVALFKTSPDAFDGKNINRLRTGAIVTIPSADEAQAVAPAEATKIVRVQASDWRAYRDQLAAAAPTSEGGGRASGGRIGTTVEEKTAPAPAGRDQLRVSREAGRGGANAEEAIAREKQLKEAQARVNELEKTVKNMERAVELKNQSLAQLQTQAETAKGKAAEPPKAPPPAVEPPKKAAEPPKAEPPKAAEAPKAEAPKVEPPKVEPPKAAEPPKPAPKAAPAKAEPSFFDDMLSSTPLWLIGAILLAVLGGIAALFAVRRRKTTKFEDSIISGTDIKTNTVFGSTGGGVVNTGENSLASDFSREGLGNIDTDEVDPIAEAEVYLAYGRDAQAEEILKDALKKDAQRQEIYLKLLEIHAQHNKPSAFETVAAELFSVSQGRGEVWEKAVALGRQLDPGNPMFTEGGAQAAAAAAAAGAAAHVEAAAPEAPIVDDLTPKAAAFRAEAGRTPKPAVPDHVATGLGDDSMMDFRLEDEISVSPTSGVAPRPSIDILASAANEIERSARAAESATTARAAPESPATTPSQKLDLEFRLDDNEKPAPMRPATPKPEPVMAGATSGGAAPSLTRPQAAIELDKLDLSFDPGKTTFDDPTPSVLDGQWHDAATKLDLAKAYQEMGDIEGAREILQEVLHEGDDQQKSEAQALLSKLG